MKNKLPNVIGLSGLAGAGKSTLACLLIAEHGYKLIKFADPLKAMLRGYYENLGLSDHAIQLRIEGSLKEVPDADLGGKTPRYAMQTLGTEWGRALIGQHLWTNAAETKLQNALACGQRVVFDDLRFENEAAVIRRNGGTVVRIERTGVALSDSAHASELGVKADVVIVNDGEPEAMLEQLCAFAT
ncbi:MAG: hypothetical protein U5K75_10645 [Ahrensia sp.]|nr:hypothetical protein [Ahrensia sp.]